MKAIWPKDARSRMMLTLQLAVILPAAILVFLSARHLREIHRERSIQAAIQVDFGQVLAIYEKQIDHKAYDLLDDIRDKFPAPGEACSVTLDRILASHPYVAHVMVYHPHEGFVFRSQPYLLKNDPSFHDEAEHFSKMVETWWRLDYDDFSKKLAMMAE